MKVLIALLLGGIVELSVMYLVADWIGFLSMLGLLFLLSLIGFAVIRMAGLRTLRRFNEASASGQPPSRELADGAVLLTAGILLAVPGFVSGAFGLLFLLPPVRALVRNQLSKRASALATRTNFQSRTIIATYERDGVQDATSTEVHGELLPPNDRDDV